MWDSASKIFQALKTNRSLQRLNLSVFYFPPQLPNAVSLILLQGNRIVYEDEPDLDLSNNLSLTHLSFEVSALST